MRAIVADDFSPGLERDEKGESLATFEDSRKFERVDDARAFITPQHQQVIIFADQIICFCGFRAGKEHIVFRVTGNRLYIRFAQFHMLGSAECCLNTCQRHIIDLREFLPYLGTGKYVENFLFYPLRDVECIKRCPFR